MDDSGDEGGRQRFPLSGDVAREIYNSVNDAIFVHDAETGDILDVNDTACQMYGYTRDEARRLSVEDISSGVPPYTQDTATDYMRKAAGGDPQVFDWQAEDSDGTQFRVEVSMRRAVIGDETLVLGIVRDTSGRKTHERGLERLHGTTRDLVVARSADEVASITCDAAVEVLELPLVGVHLYDADADALVPVAWSDALASVLDGPPPAIPAGEGLAWETYTDGEPSVYANVREQGGVLDADTPFLSELQLPLGEHGVIVAGSTNAGDFDATDVALGNVLAANAEAALDHVERERELAEERNKYETVVEQSYDGITIIRDGVFVFANPRSLDILGYEASELIGKPLVDIIAPDERDRVRDRYEHRVDAEPDSLPEAQYEARVLTGDESTRVAEITAAPIQYEGELADLKIFRDVTERKRYEEQLEETTAELEALNRVVRHDIRNDMGVVLGWAHLLEGHVDEEGEEYLTKILASGEHVVELTEIARDYIETLTSEGDLAVSPTPLCSTLETELDLRRETFPEADFVLDGDVPDVSVAANEMLGSVFRNLLNNAVQHNDKDRPVVTISCEVDDGDVVVRIADNGPGIPADRRASIFAKGEHGIASSGSGIGLYLVQTLVAQYGGAVAVEDDEPEGAVFTVRLPRVD